MKWIGQRIWDLISRFRNDVYLEDVSSGTIASGGNLGLDSSNKIVKTALTNTTYSISCVDGDMGAQEKIRLTSSASDTDDVVLEAGTGLTISRTGDMITFVNSNPVAPSTMGSGNSYAAGLTPAGSGTHSNLFLRKDGTWVVPPDENTQLTTIETTQYVSFSFKATSYVSESCVSPGANGIEHYLWGNNNQYTVGGTQAASVVPNEIADGATLSIDYLDQGTSGWIVPEDCKFAGFYGNMKTNGTSPNDARPVFAIFKAEEPSDRNNTDITATVIAFDKYDTTAAGSNMKNRFLKVEKDLSSSPVTLNQGDILFPAAGLDAEMDNSNGYFWGNFTMILLKQLK